MNVIRHDDEGVDLHAGFRALILHDGQEKFDVSFNLKYSSSLRGDKSDEECSDFLRGERHWERIIPSEAKASYFIAIKSGA